MYLSRRRFLGTSAVMIAPAWAHADASKLPMADEPPNQFSQLGRILTRAPHEEFYTKLALGVEPASDDFLGIKPTKRAIPFLLELEDKWRARVEALYFYGDEFANIEFLGIKDWPALKMLYFSATYFTDQALEILARFADQLTHLALNNTFISDDSIQHINRLKKLGHLSLSQTRITDQGIAMLDAVLPLKSLSLARLRISGDVLKPLAAYPSLETLNLSSTRLGDKSVSHLAACTQLRDVSLFDSTITSTGMDALGALPRLETLNVTGSPIGLLGSTLFPALKSLKLDNCRDAVPDPGFATSFAKLNKISLRGFRITDEWLEQLIKLPNLESVGLDEYGLTPKQRELWAGEKAKHDATINTARAEWLKLIETLGDTSQGIEVRKKAISILAANFAGEPKMVPALIDKARQEINYVSPEGYINVRVINSCAVLFQMPEKALLVHKDLVCAFAQDVISENAGRLKTIRSAQDVLKHAGCGESP